MATSGAGYARSAKNNEISQVLPSVDERVDYWCGQWASWCRRDDTKLGYPDKSVGFSTGGESQRWDDYAEQEEESLWVRNCLIMDALIEDLSNAQKTAIRQVYLGELVVFRFNRLFELLELASD